MQLLFAVAEWNKKLPVGALAPGKGVRPDLAEVALDRMGKIALADERVVLACEVRGGKAVVGVNALELIRTDKIAGRAEDIARFRNADGLHEPPAAVHGGVAADIHARRRANGQRQQEKRREQSEHGAQNIHFLRAAFHRTTSLQ